MAAVASGSLDAVFSSRFSSLQDCSDDYAVQSLALKWESPPEPCHDYRQFLRRNRHDTLLATASSNYSVDQVTEVWDIEGKVMLERLDTPHTQTSCMDWLHDNSFFTGGHDNSLSYWRDGRKLAQLTGHCDWVRSVAVNKTDTVLASGVANTVVGLWDIPTMQNIRMVLFPVAPSTDVNAIMDLHFLESDPETYYILERSGFIALCDLRSSRPTEWRTFCHLGKAAYMVLSEDPMHFASSARGSEIKYWDVRQMRFPSSVDAYVHIYNQHRSQQLPLGLDFLHYEKYIVSGSDDGHVYIYETSTERLVHKLRLGFGQVQSGCALDAGSLSFYVTFKNAQYLGLVDTEGDNITYEITSSEQIKWIYSKEAWDIAIGKYTERILNAIRTVHSVLPVEYESWINIIRASDLPVCKELIRDIDQQYEEQIQASAPQLVRDLQEFYAKQMKMEKQEKCSSPVKTREKGQSFSVVQKECETVERFQSSR